MSSGSPPCQYGFSVQCGSPGPAPLPTLVLQAEVAFDRTHSEKRLSRYVENSLIVACLYIDCPKAQLIFIHVHSVDLQSSCRLLCRSDVTVEGAILLRVRELLRPKDLKFPVLFDERKDEERIVVDLGAVDGGAHGCGLHRDYVISLRGDGSV